VNSVKQFLMLFTLIFSFEINAAALEGKRMWNSEWMYYLVFDLACFSIIIVLLWLTKLISKIPKQ
jgi:hypothetical protein